MSSFAFSPSTGSRGKPHALPSVKSSDDGSLDIAFVENFQLAPGARIGSAPVEERPSVKGARETAEREKCC
jgi:hypothetical protein